MELSRLITKNIVKPLYYSIIAISLILTSCAKPDKGEDGSNGIGCTIQSAVNGAIVTCATGSVLITNGLDGVAGVDGHDGLDGHNGVDSIAQLIDPCGDNPGQFDEVLIRLSTGQLLAYFESGGNRFLSLIGNGNYRTTDSQSCHFTVNNGVISW